MKIKGKLMDAAGMRNTLRRLAHQVIEKNDGAEDLVVIGIRTRGVTVARRVKADIDAIEGTDVPMGVFDIALYRDDLEDPASEIEFSGSEISFGVDGKTVLTEQKGRHILPYPLPTEIRVGIVYRFNSIKYKYTKTKTKY